MDAIFLEIKDKYHRCARCKLLRKKSNFNIARKTYCKACVSFFNKRIKESFKNRKDVIIPEKKKCKLCKNTLESKHFNKSYDRKDGLSDNCRECDKKTRFNMVKFKMDKKVELGGKCVSCGFDDITLLQFDHLFDKKYSLASLRNKKLIEKEVKKCQLLCPNCHYIKSFKIEKMSRIDTTKYSTIKTREARDRNWKYVNDYKMNLQKCSECDYRVTKENLPAFHFDHLDIKTKKKEVSILCRASYSLKTVQEEIAKCRLICANCHYKHTAVQLNWRNHHLYKNIL